MQTRLAIIGAALAASPLRGQLPAARPVTILPGTLTADTLGVVSSMRPLSDGRVLVYDAAKRRVVMLDATLSTLTPVALPLTGRGAAAPTLRLGPLVALPGDSTLVIDMQAQLFRVLDSRGIVVGQRTLATPADVGKLGTAPGTSLDVNGCLIYAARTPIAGPTAASTAEILRLDLVSGVALQVASYDYPPGVQIQVVAGPPVPSPLSTPPAVRKRRATTVPVYDIGDDWVTTPAGRIAIARAHDYHIDWIEPNGAVVSSPPVAWPWRILTPATKQRLVDSLQKEYDDLDRRAQATRGTDSAVTPISIVVDSAIVSRAMPDSVQPFVVRSMRADTQGRVWLREGFDTILGPAGPSIYDVIDASGRLVDRVLLPNGRTLVGFGANGTIYVTRKLARGMVLERATLPPR